LAFGFWLLAFGFWLLAFGFWLLAFGFLTFLIKFYLSYHLIKLGLEFAKKKYYFLLIYIITQRLQNAIYFLKKDRFF
jgi:hypothetical protein